MQFNLQVSIEVYQDVTWGNGAGGYQYEVAIDGLDEPVTLKGGINQQGILTPTAANHNLIRGILGHVEGAIKGAMSQAQAQVEG